MSVKTADLESKYNKRIIQKRELLKYLYRKISPALEKTGIYILYITRGEAETVAENILMKGRKIETACKNMFLESTSEMRFIGSNELITAYRNVRNGLVQLKVKKAFQSEKDFVALVQLSDYYAFITDSEHKLKRYYFDENVRDFLGLNRTNTDIMNTLNSSDSIEFWNLNNGITMLASKATLYDDFLEVENVQIVNGLQTTNSIYNYFFQGNIDNGNRSVLIKLITSSEPEVRKKIIQATNNQSSMPLYSLHAMDKIQKDIEDILYRENIYYDRRDKYYKNLGKSASDIVTPLYLASGYVNLILKLPHRAITLKSKFMNNEVQYNKIFNKNAPIYVWINIAKILKHVDRITPKCRKSIDSTQEKYLRTLRPIVSLSSVACVLGKYDFGTNDIIGLDCKKITDEMIRDITNRVLEIVSKSDNKSIHSLYNRQQTNTVLKALATQYNISDFDSIKSRPNFILDDYKIDEEFLSAIRKNIPPQPWETAIHKTIASKLGCSNEKVSRAIEILIENGEYKKQINGRVEDERSCSEGVR